MTVSFKTPGYTVAVLIIWLAIAAGEKWKWKTSDLMPRKIIHTDLGEKRSDCLCPPNQEEDDGKFCGTDLKTLNNNNDKCDADVIYRCIGSDKKAIFQTDCVAGSYAYRTKGLKCRSFDCKTITYDFGKEKCLYIKERICA